MSHWSNPDTLPPENIASMVTFIEERAHTPEQQRVHRALVAALHPCSGEHLLDLGCGTGIIARYLAEHVTERGMVLGIDISHAMLEAARRLAEHPALRFEQSNAATLPCETASFDGAAVARLLLHVEEPQTVLQELRRVVRRGGRVVLLEWDWGTLALDHSDRVLTRRILDWRCDHYGGNNWMGRQLVRRCMEAGWRIRDLEVLVTVSRDAHANIVDTLPRVSEFAVANGAITAAERTAWLAELEQRLQAGTFFATINDYIVVVE